MPQGVQTKSSQTQIKMKKGYTDQYKQLTFKFPLQKHILDKLDQKVFLSKVMINKAQINLSGNYYKKWTYSGKALVSENQSKMQEAQNSTDTISLEKTQINDSQNEQQTKMSNESFFKVIRQAKWESAKINLVSHSNPNLIKQISCIDFPKLLKLQLIANNINSVQFLQTLNFPNLQSLRLNLNKITNIKSLQKINCFNIKQLDLKANFLNIQKTFQGLTKLNAQKLSKVDFKCQNDIFIFQQLDTLIARKRQRLDRYYRYYQFQHPYDFQNEQDIIEDRIIHQYYRNNSLFNIKRNVSYLFQNRPPIQLIDYLIKQTLNFYCQSHLYRFLLKTNSNSQKLLNPQANRYPLSSYQYFIYYSTDIDKFIQIFDQKIQMKQKQEYNYYMEHYGDQWSEDYQYYQAYYGSDPCEMQDYSDDIVKKKGFYYR